MEDLRVTVEAMEDCKTYDAYTLYVSGKQRVLTVVTRNDLVAKKWLDQLLKHSKNGRIVVGFCASIWNGTIANAYDLLKIFTGSQCLLYIMPEKPYSPTPKFVQNFFENRRVTVVGFDMVSLAKHMEDKNQIKIANAVEVKADAVEVKDMDMVKTVRAQSASKKPRWFTHTPRSYISLTEEKVISSTLESFLCFSTGYKVVVSSSSLKKR